MTPLENAQATRELIDKETGLFVESVQKTQRYIYNRLHYLAGKLLIDASGNIKPSIENMRILNQIEKAMKDEIITKEYTKRVDRITRQFPKIKGLNDVYFLSLVPKFNEKNDLYKNQIKRAVNLTRSSLLDAGVQDNVIDPVIKMLDSSIVNGAKWSDMVDELELKIKGSPDTLGGLERYSKQIVTDTLNQYNANYNKVVSEKLGLEWYYYSGGLRSTSRPFCRGHHEKYYHKKEVEDFGRGKDIDGTRLTSKERQGRVKGTNASNIFRYRGGYNCGHIYIATLITMVPKSVINRNIKKGYFKLKSLQKKK